MNCAIQVHLRLSVLAEALESLNSLLTSGLTISEITEVFDIASIVKRRKTYSVFYYEGEGKNRYQVWESDLRYSTAKSRKATIEYEKEQNTHINHNDITVSRFLYEFVENTARKNG